MKVQEQFTRAIALHQQGRLKEAQAIYQSILKTDPGNGDALHMLGFVAAQSGDNQLAADLIAKAIAINPNEAVFYSNRGNALQSLKQWDAALASYDRAIGIKPDYADAHYNRGNALQELRQLDAAVASYDKAISLKPGCPEFHYNRGNALQALRQCGAAVAGYDQAIRIKPDYAEAHGNRGIALQTLKQFGAAVASYDQAIRIKQDYAEAHNNRGIALQSLKQFDAALASYERAIRINPNYADAYDNRGNVLLELQQLDAAVASYDRAIGLKPDCEYLFGALLHTRMRLCDWSNFDSNIPTLINKISGNLKVSPSFPLLALTDSPPVQRRASEIWVADKHPFNPSLGLIPRRERSHKIRVGYYSADFHNHATCWLMAELFERHDKSRFELTAFSFGPDKNDEMRRRVSSAFDQFIDVRLKSDEAIASLSRSLGIDIAVDLKGFTHDNRNAIFSYRAAPIQVSYLGYPGTLGANYVDYLIADMTLIPDESRQHYSEKIVYLPNSYQVNGRNRVIAEHVLSRQKMGLPVQGFVFCCFNNNYKITPAVFSAWVRILNAVEGSVLWLLEDNPTAATNLRAEAARRGLDTTRLVFAGRMEVPEHIARHRLADLFLDTRPFNAHTTASDALWAGLPVLTRIGESFAGRVAASLLNAIGLPELITETEDDYEALAIKLGNDAAMLQAIKTKLERNRLTTALFDTALYSGHLEAAYMAMYERYQSDLSPDHIF